MLLQYNHHGQQQRPQDAHAAMSHGECVIAHRGLSPPQRCRVPTCRDADSKGMSVQDTNWAMAGDTRAAFWKT